MKLDALRTSHPIQVLFFHIILVNISHPIEVHRLLSCLCVMIYYVGEHWLARMMVFVCVHTRVSVCVCLPSP